MTVHKLSDRRQLKNSDELERANVERQLKHSFLRQSIHEFLIVTICKNMTHKIEFIQESMEYAAKVLKESINEDL